MKFEQPIDIRWSDCDANGHVRHSAYYDYAAHMRIKLLAAHGFDMAKMALLQIGPILFKEECSFLKEIRMNDEIYINALKGHITADGGKWVLHHEIFNKQGKKHAHVTVQGAWMNLKLRKLAIPPSELTNVFNELAQGKSYVYQKK